MYVMFKEIYEELKRRYCTVLSRVSTMTHVPCSCPAVPPHFSLCLSNRCMECYKYAQSVSLFVLRHCLVLFACLLSHCWTQTHTSSLTVVTDHTQRPSPLVHLWSWQAQSVQRPVFLLLLWAFGCWMLAAVPRACWRQLVRGLTVGSDLAAMPAYCCVSTRPPSLSVRPLFTRLPWRLVFKVFISPAFCY